MWTKAVSEESSPNRNGGGRTGHSRRTGRKQWIMVDRDQSNIKEDWTLV